jgi:hypothetical protein
MAQHICVGEFSFLQKRLKIAAARWLFLGPHVAFMLRGAAAALQKPLKINGSR